MSQWEARGERGGCGKHQQVDIVDLPSATQTKQSKTKQRRTKQNRTKFNVFQTKKEETVGPKE